MVTMKDIAQQANVSITTVSNVINGNYYRVSTETVAKIQQIITETGYAPNMSARSLVKNNSQIIGVINHLMGSSFLRDPFQTMLLSSIENILTKNGYFMMVHSVRTTEDLLHILRCWSMDGLIITGLFKDSFFEEILHTHNPFVLIDSYVDNKKIMNVGLEDYRGGFEATQYLIEKGHKRIAFVSPKANVNGVIAERFRGYSNALKESGIELRKNDIFEVEITIDEGIAFGHKLANINEITAVVASADILAAGIISGLNDCGLKVPENVSVVGFDDLEICKITGPKLTTIHQDLDNKGSIAAQMMIDAIEGNPIKTKNIVLPVHLVERESVRKLN